MSDYYDIHGKPMEMPDWAKCREVGGDWERVKQSTKVSAETDVSTVWLGLDHSFGVGPPLIFETMVFGGNLDQYQYRYATLEQARTGHDEAVQKVKDEAASFADLAADERVRDCVALLEQVLAEHRSAFDLGEYADLYAPLVKAVTP